MSDAKTLAELADKQAISELIHRYCRAVDRLDVPLGHSIWHADGWADYGPEFYQGPGKGVIDLICAQHRRTRHHSHQVTNILIDLDGDRAGSEAYCLAALRIEHDGVLSQVTVWSRYLDSWERRAGRWGLMRRVAVRDFDEIREVKEMQRHEHGTRDPNDPSYAVLAKLK
jgi:hypothetical protein